MMMVLKVVEAVEIELGEVMVAEKKVGEGTALVAVIALVEGELGNVVVVMVTGMKLV